MDAAVDAADVPMTEVGDAGVGDIGGDRQGVID